MENKTDFWHKQTLRDKSARILKDWSEDHQMLRTIRDTLEKL